MLIFCLLDEMAFHQVIDHVVWSMRSNCRKGPIITTSSSENISSLCPTGEWQRINEKIIERPQRVGNDCQRGLGKKPGRIPTTAENFSRVTCPRLGENFKLGGNILEEELDAEAGNDELWKLVLSRRNTLTEKRLNSERPEWTQTTLEFLRWQCPPWSFWGRQGKHGSHLPLFLTPPRASWGRTSSSTRKSVGDWVGWGWEGRARTETQKTFPGRDLDKRNFFFWRSE